jgi:DNA-binding CsgD family transcriptional regulator
MGGQVHHGDVAGGAGELTVREREVVAFALAGASNRAIARQLHVSVRTVEGHLYQIYAKLNIPGRVGLREALAEGLCEQALG